MRCFKGIICIAITILLFAPTAGYSADMIYATGYVENHDSAGIGAKKWFAKVKEVTNGRVNIKGTYGGALLKPDEVLDGLQNKVADFGYVLFGQHPGKLPMTVSLSTLVDLKRGSRIDTRVIYAMTMKLYSEFLVKEFGALNVKPLIYSCPQPYVLVSKTPVRTLNDMKGLKVRTFGQSLLTMVKAAGAVPVAMSFSELYTSLSTGVVQGAITDPGAIFTGKLHEAAPHLTIFGSKGGAPVSFASVGILVNLDNWNSKISKADQAAIEKMTPEFMMSADWEGWLKNRAKERLEDIRKAGAKIYVLPDDEVLKWANLCPDFLGVAGQDLDKKGLPGTKLVERWKELADDHISGKWNP